MNSMTCSCPPVELVSLELSVMSTSFMSRLTRTTSSTLLTSPVSATTQRRQNWKQSRGANILTSHFPTLSLSSCLTISKSGTRLLRETSDRNRVFQDWDRNDYPVAFPDDLLLSPNPPPPSSISAVSSSCPPCLALLLTT